MKEYVIVIIMVLAMVSNIVAVIMIGMLKPSQSKRIFVGMVNIAFTFVLAILLLVFMYGFKAEPNKGEFRYQYVPIPQDSLFIKVPIQP